MDLWILTRNLANVANLSTPLGLALAALGGGRLRRVGGQIVAEDVTLPVVTAGAMTVGSVVLVFDQPLEELERRFPQVLTHEEQHSWQWAYCLGLPFLPLYFAAMGWSQLRCGDRASANAFEIQAGLQSGGYESRPKRSFSQILLLRKGRLQA